MSWLYTHVLREDADRAPLFSEQSAINWVRALHFEVIAAHGSRPAEQFEACRRALRAHAKIGGAPLSEASVFEPLVGAIVNAMSLESLSNRAKPWDRPSAIVTWYYAVYWSVRAMFAAVGQAVGENHSAAIRTYASVLRTRMPHPFDMHGRHVKNEEYSCALPIQPSAPRQNISGTFTRTATCARGMLLEYLSGTAQWYVDRTKTELRERRGVTEFRTRASRELRDSRLQKDIAFLHCAFRYRTKANYRDAVYLTYGSRVLQGSNEFEGDLAGTAKFLVLIALALAGWHVGQSTVAAFVRDLRENLRGVPVPTLAPAFWAELPVGTA